MAKTALALLPEFEPLFGPYDRDNEEEPWFLPGPEEFDTDLPPLPRADRRLLVDPSAWARAEADHAADLARVALLYGALEQQLASGPPGWRHRLAVQEAAAQSWAVGDRISAERLSLWSALRLSALGDDAQALGRAAWALRRLASNAPVAPDLAAFLGRPDASESLADLAEVDSGLTTLHPLTRAAALSAAWTMLGDPGPVRQIEAATLAARLAATMGRRPGGFLPLALGGAALPQGSAPAPHLSTFLRAAERASLAALLHLDRLRAWATRAEKATADLQGRTPPRLIALMAEWPIVTAAMATQALKANQATILRNLATLQTRDLIREITGQGRYRVWMARV